MRLRVLIVEDEEALIEPLKYNFTKEGYIVDTALDGEIALDKIFNKPPELILLDWMLPKISGIDLCKRIRNNKETKNIPIIMLTARGEENDRIQGLEIGADDYVTKPFDKTILEARISACIEKKQLRDKEKELLEEIRKEKDKSEKILKEKKIDFITSGFEILNTNNFEI